MSEPSANEVRRIKLREKNGSFPEDKHCAICRAHMPGKKKNARYCSNRCRQENKYNKKRKRVLTVTLP